MPYHFFECFFILALLFLPWVTQQIRDNKYRGMVLDCCNDVRGKVASLNRLLPDAYKLLAKEHVDISALFHAYQLWLLIHYTERNLKHILYGYHHYLSRRNRKLYHLENLNCDLFFIETILYFLQDCNRQEKIGEQKLYNLGYTQDEDNLTSIGIVAYKIMLAVHIAHEAIGVHDFQREGIQSLIDKSRS